MVHFSTQKPDMIFLKPSRYFAHLKLQIHLNFSKVENNYDVKEDHGFQKMKALGDIFGE